MINSKSSKIIQCLFLASCILAGALLRIPLIKLLVTRDEAASAVSSLTNILTVYRGPTNHIFHEILTQSVIFVGGFNFVSLRTVPFVTGLSLVPLVFYFGKHFFNEYAGILASLLVVTSYPLIDVSAEAVGYSLLILISTACYYLTLTIIRDGTTVRYVILGFLFSIGAYTIPIMVYPAGICCAWIIIQALQDSSWSLTMALKNLMMTLVTSAVLTTLFFLPVILNRGVQFITGNRHLNPEPYTVMIQKNWQLLVQTINFWSGGYTSVYLVVGGAGLIGSMFYVNQKRDVQSLLIGTILWFGLMFILHPVDLFKTRFLIHLLPLGYVIISGGLLYWSTRIGSAIDWKNTVCVIAVGLLFAGNMYTQLHNYRLTLDGPTMEAGHEYASKIRQLIRKHEGEISVHNPFGATRQKYFLSEPFVPGRFQPGTYNKYDRHIVTCDSNRPFRHVKRFYANKELNIIRHRNVYKNTIGKILILKVTKMDDSSLWS